jgi:hypothetical protein
MDPGAHDSANRSRRELHITVITRRGRKALHLEVWTEGADGKMRATGEVAVLESGNWRSLKAVLEGLKRDGRSAAATTDRLETNCTTVKGEAHDNIQLEQPWRQRPRTQ